MNYGNHFTSRAIKAIEFAQYAARELEQDYIGTEHILLGLLGKELARVVDIDLDLSARKSLNFLLENVHCLCMRICWHTD